MIFLDKEVFLLPLDREDYYLAQIAAEARKGWVKHPDKVRVEDMILDFSIRKQTSEKGSAPTPDFKNYWLGALGVSEHV